MERRVVALKDLDKAMPKKMRQAHPLGGDWGLQGDRRKRGRSNIAAMSLWKGVSAYKPVKYREGEDIRDSWKVGLDMFANFRVRGYPVTMIGSALLLTEV